MIDRTLAPQLEKVSSITPLSLKPSGSIKGCPVYLMDDSSEDLTKIEVVFPAGTGEETKSLLAAATSAMLVEGAGNYTARDISEITDYYGAKIQASVGRDMCTLRLIALKNRVEDVLPIFQAVVQYPTFPQSEFDLYKSRAKSSLKTNLDRVEIQARLNFSQLFFGKSKYVEKYALDDFDLLKTEDLKAFHRTNYRLADARIFISGAHTSSVFKMLDSCLEADQKSFVPRGMKGLTMAKEIKTVEKPNALQSAVRIGFGIPPRQHDSYPAFSLMNTVFGGYFGSRLMQNIREEKGYTYGISSSLNHLKHSSYAVITTQVGAEHTLSTLTEIRKEMIRLQREELSKDELNLVKNYTAGSLLKGFDGVFSKAGLIRMMVIQNMDEDYFSHFLDSIHSLTSRKIKNAAMEYLNFESMTTAVVGKKLSNNEISQLTSE
jgi:predicted Zn-dependent peptidase